MDRDKVTCKAIRLESGTKYYVELIATNLDIATRANFTDVTTE